MWALLLLTFKVSSMDTEYCRRMECNSGYFKKDCYSVSEEVISVHACQPENRCATEIFNTTKEIVDLQGEDKDIYGDINGDGDANEIDLEYRECYPIFREGTCAGDFTLTEGRYCCSDNDCKSETCVNQVCRGISGCDVDEDCINNNYCSGGSCVSSKSDGSSCSRDAECSVGSGCNVGICTELLSLKVGSYVSDSKFCITNYTSGKEVQNGEDEAYCDSVQVWVNRTLQSSPFECFTTKDWCNYTLVYGNRAISYERCLCDGNGKGDNGIEWTKGYCSYYVVNDFDYAKSMYSYLKYKTSNCGGKYRSTIDPKILVECGSIGRGDRYSYLKALYRGYYWNLYMGGILEGCAVIMDLYDPAWEVGEILRGALGIIIAITFL